MKNHLGKAATLLSAALIAACAQTPTSPSIAEKAPAAQKAGDTGSVTGSAAGDVKNGPIEMDLVRVAQTNGVAAFYASAGGEYVVGVGKSTEIYIQIWNSNPVVVNPRMIVDWGTGDRDNIGCGGCRLSFTYNAAGRYRVTVTMDDRISGTTSRTFTLNVVREETAVLPKSGFGTFSSTLSGSEPTFTRFDEPFAPPGAAPGCFLTLGVQYYDTYTIQHPGGPLRLEIPAATFDTYLNVFSSFNSANACQNIVAADDDGGVFPLSLINANFPAGTYTVVVTSFSPTTTGSYTLLIQ